MNAAAAAREGPPALNADFFRTFVDLRRLPSSLASEIAFIGRSNAGKSSLLNTLVQKKGLARTSGTPGKTQALNYFTVNWKSAGGSAQAEMCFFVDLPGYGYAKVSRGMRAEFSALIGGYLEERCQLAATVLVCDCRRGPEDEEREICRMRKDVPLFLALTKADKLSGNEREKARERWNALRPKPAGIFFCSAKDRSAYDMGLLRGEIISVCETAGPPQGCDDS